MCNKGFQALVHLAVIVAGASSSLQAQIFALKAQS